ncbi:nitrogen regulation protein NR(II) [Egicoccus sp. AB-alg6-2]|uniref:two-component system sensor histidine kinase NtrB n=1 Tax=Egicoccus sp. AB-alg6-2 TaxID=3242692 RepID=UPI00359EA497
MSRILALDSGTGPLAMLAARGDTGLEAVTDLDGCLAALQRGRPAPLLVAIGSSWSQPLTAARRIRRANGTVGLALLVPEDQVDVARTRLALAPEITNAVVVAGDTDDAQLRMTLDAVATSASRRAQLRRALDTINRDVLDAPPVTAPEAVSPMSEQYLSALIDHAPDLILSVDAGGRIVTLNESGERLLTTNLQTVEGRPLEAVLATADPAEVVEMLAAADASRSQVRRELALERPPEAPLLLSVTAAPMTDGEGSIVGHVVIGRDITRERQSEERLRHLQQAESLATLAGGVAHDFNNLLVGVQGWASIARASTDDPQMVDHALEQILEASGRAAELARSMLAYSGRGSIELTTVDLNDLVTGMIRLLRSSVPPKTRLEVALDAEVPQVRADATQLRQVLMNLVINASEAIGEQGGQILVTSGTLDLAGDAALTHPTRLLPPGSYVIVDVVDDGPGMDDEVRQRMFAPFFSTKFAGRGLGLAASAGIVAAHGGAIDVDSAPGQGARFRLLLPFPGQATG